MIIGNLFEEFVKYSSLDSFVAFFSYLDSMFEDEIDTLSLDRCREYNRSIREKIELLREIMHISI